jgi:hypothetical protein
MICEVTVELTSAYVPLFQFRCLYRRSLLLSPFYVGRAEICVLCISEVYGGKSTGSRPPLRDEVDWYYIMTFHFKVEAHHWTVY